MAGALCTLVVHCVHCWCTTQCYNFADHNELCAVMLILQIMMILMLLNDNMIHVYMKEISTALVIIHAVFI